MTKSESISELAAALAKASAKLKNPAFDSANPFFKSKYASLAAVRNAVVPVLAEEGLSVVQEITHADGKSACSSILLHTSGQWLQLEPFTVPVAKADAQGACAGATYARRASLQALGCVVGDDDADGEDIVGRDGAAAPATTYTPKYQRGKKDVLPPAGDPAEALTAPPAANADPAAGSASLATGFLNTFASCSTLEQVEGTVKGVVLIAAKLTEADKAKLRDAAAAARLRVAATPAKLVDVPALLREITGLRQQLGDGMFLVELKKHGGEERAGLGLSAEKLVGLRDACLKMIG